MSCITKAVVCWPGEEEIERNGCQEDGARLFSEVPSKRIRGNKHKLKYRKFVLCIRKNFLVLNMGEHWNRLPSDDVEACL